MSRERTREGRREVRPTAVDRLAARLSTERGTALSGGDVARMRPEERRRLLMRLGYLDGRASAAELRAALGDEEPRPVGRPPAAGEARSVELRVRVSPAEMAELERRAKVARWSLSEWVRASLLGDSGADTEE